MLSDKQLNPMQLWRLKPSDFNLWRQKNDLPDLFNYFKEKLPKFDEWLSRYKISDDEFVKATSTAKWFLGDDQRYLYHFKKDGESTFSIHINPTPQNSISPIQKDIVWKKRFVPYLSWAKLHVARYGFIVADKGNKSFVEKFVYNLWSASETYAYSRAYLFQNYPVLKLGGVRLPNGTSIGDRNLDFVDLDGLVIEGDNHGPYSVHINIASCRNMSFKETDLHHFYFSDCQIEDMAVIESRLQDFYFTDCDLARPRFERCRIYKMGVANTWIGQPRFTETDISEFTYIPDKKTTPANRFNNYRVLRTAFQHLGKRSEASHYYYLERCAERKMLYSPYSSNSKKFPRSKYRGDISSLIVNFRRKRITRKQLAKLLMSLVWFHINKWINPRYFVFTAYYKLKYLSSLINYLSWGYGERPARVLGWAALFVVAFGAVFYLWPDHKTSGDILTSFYFSVVTFTTLGYGDIAPTGYMRLVCAAEALLGALSIGLMIAAFSNKTRY
jgi:hypothetical protein